MSGNLAHAPGAPSAPSAPSAPHRHSIAQIEDINAANRFTRARPERAGSFALPDESHIALQSQLSHNAQQSHMLGHMDKQPPIPPKDTERPRPKPTIPATPPPVPLRAPAVPKRTYVPATAAASRPIDSTCRSHPSPQPAKAGAPPPIPPPASRPRKADKAGKKPDAKPAEFRSKIPPPPTGPPPNVPVPAPAPKVSNVPPPLGSIQKSASNNKISMRQDSSVSSDSFSQTSSPSYTTKTMETPLLPHGAGARALCNGKAADKGPAARGGTVAAMLARKRQSESEMKDMNGNGALTKSASTPASLQTIVRFHNGSNMSLHHRIIRDMRRPSSHYVSRIRLRFRLAQVVVNAIALLAIGGGLAAYFKAYPSSVQVVNNSTPIVPPQTGGPGANPAPGICLPVIVSFCQYHKVPYNFTVFPNYMGHFGQRDAQQELEVYDAVVDVRCYELAALFLCSVFVPKCGPTGQVVRPCQKLCSETKRRCGFFLDVFGLALPEYLECNLFPDSPDPDVCVGHHEVNEAEKRAQKPVCPSGFQCDVKRCIPRDWKCDGHLDCEDQSDELNCEECSSKGMIHCGEKRCVAQEHLCDGKVDCPLAQDERNCTQDELIPEYIININNSTPMPKIQMKENKEEFIENTSEKSEINEETPENILPQPGSSKVCAILPIRRFIIPLNEELVLNNVQLNDENNNNTEATHENSSVQFVFSDQFMPRLRKISPVRQKLPKEEFASIVEDSNETRLSELEEEAGTEDKRFTTPLKLPICHPVSPVSPQKRKIVKNTVTKGVCKKIRTILPKPNSEEETETQKVETVTSQSLLKQNQNNNNGGIIRALLLKPSNPQISLLGKIPKTEATNFKTTSITTTVVSTISNNQSSFTSSNLVDLVSKNTQTVLLQVPNGKISSVPLTRPFPSSVYQHSAPRMSVSSTSLINLLTNQSSLIRKVQPVLPNVTEGPSPNKMSISMGKPTPSELRKKLEERKNEEKRKAETYSKPESPVMIEAQEDPAENTNYYESLIDNEILSHLFDYRPLTVEDVQNLDVKSGDQTVPDQIIVRLSERNGDEGRGQLQVYFPEHKKFIPACVTPGWNQTTSPVYICNLLGYSTSNGSRLIGATDKNISPPVYDMQTSPNKSKKNLMKELGSCKSESYTTVDLTCTNYICGKIRKSYAERASVRIVGGTASKPGDWPFLAALLGGPEEVFYCAGVLIADQWVLTASHCVGNHSDVTGWTIQLGITRRHAHSYFGQKMKVRRVVPHPMYNLGVAHDNDIALFQLASPVTFHEHLLPVCLPPDDKELRPGINCTVIGWGKKEDKDMSEYEPAVNEVEVPVLDRDLCNTWLENRDLNVTDGMICAGFKEGGKDACQGDSGGPLLCKDDNDKDRWFVGGIVSWGIKCAHPHLPGVYAYVPKYIRWIKQQMALYSD